jgi:antagonist of KipI
MSLQVIKSGTPITVQDFGRWGFQSQGVPVSGAMDEDSLLQANLLVGNDCDCACLEILSGQSEWRVMESSLITLTGKGIKLFLDDQEIPTNQSVWIQAETNLKTKPTSNGSWSYLAIGGGFRADKVMNSRSTYLLAGFGGVEGRVLQSGDTLESGHKSTQTLSLENSLSTSEEIYRAAGWGIAESKQKSDNIIRVMAGPEWGWLSDVVKEKFMKDKFSISADSSRMGYRLKGSPLKRSNETEMISSPVSKGTIQLTNDGSLIALMADGQTVGGYPRVAQVVAVDLPKFVQRRVGESVRFKMISFQDAEQLFLSREQERRQIAQTIKLKIQS